MNHILPTVSCKELVSYKPYDEYFSYQTCLVKMAGYSQRPFCMFMNLSCTPVHEQVKKILVNTQPYWLRG